MSRSRLLQPLLPQALVAAAVVAAIPAAALAQPAFVHASKSAGLDAVHTPMQFESNPWTCGGMAVGDFNRDGYADLFVVNGGTAPDKLFINAGDGTFVDEALDWGLSAVHCGNAAAVGDCDRDGWPDVYVTSMGDEPGPDQPGKNRLYRNNGDGTFTEVAIAAGVAVASPTSSFVSGAAFGDYDLDGDLDLFVCTWLANVNGNRLYRNNGNGTFSNVTSSTIGAPVLGPIYGFQPAFADMNGDLWPELLIAADFQTSRYLVNDGDGTFTNYTVASGTGLDDNGMGQTVADFDNDGRLDWYVSSIFNDTPPPGNYLGNTHYRAIGPHQYEEIALVAGDRDGGWGWGTIAIDADQDGWLDIIETNGREADPPGQWTAEQAYLWWNDGDGSFTEIALSAGLVHLASGRATVWFDAENDGDLDVAIVTNAGPLDYYRNQTPAPGHWLQIELDTSSNPLLAPDGFQTRVEATVAGQACVQYMNSSPSYLGTSQHIVHFGLGEATVVDELRIIWSRGYQMIIELVAADQKITITAPELADITADGQVNVSDLVELILRWGPVAGSGQLVADLDNDHSVAVPDLVTLLLDWGPAP